MNFSSFLGGRGKRTVNKENEEDCLPKNTGNKRVTFDVQDGEDTENEQHSNRQPTPHPNKKLKGNDEEGGATRLPRPPPPAFHDGNGLVEDNQEDSRRAGNNDVEEGERFDQVRHELYSTFCSHTQLFTNAPFCATQYVTFDHRRTNPTKTKKARMVTKKMTAKKGQPTR